MPRLIRRAVEGELPSRLATNGQHRRSLADLDAFRRGAEIHAEIAAADGRRLSEGARDRVRSGMEEALLALAESVQQFDRDLKLEALNRARRELARATSAEVLLF